MPRIFKFWKLPPIWQALFLYFFIGIFLTGLIFKWIDPSKLNSTEEKIKFAQVVATTWGGLAVGFNLYYGGKRSEAANRNAKAAEEGQITERFTQAVEQLGNEKISIRIGGIYTLERIAQNSSQDHWRVMETLSAFVRENAPFKANTNNQNSENEHSKPNTDIQAILTVIGRRSHEKDPLYPPSKCIDLSYSDLQGAFLFQVHLQGAYLVKVNLKRAILDSARLEKARLGDTNLKKARLDNARLENACLVLANLQKANLRKANLQDAYLQGADLEEAINITQEQIEKTYGDEFTILPDGLQRPEHWKSSEANNASD